VALGVSLDHLHRDLSGEVVFAFAALGFGGTYAIQGSDRLYRAVRPLLVWLGLKESPSHDGEGPGPEGRDIFILGFYRLASSLVEELRRSDPGMLARLTMVDFNPVTHADLRALGVRVLYGDLGQRDTLARAGVSHARLVLLTLSGWILKGVAPERLIRTLRALNPGARLVVVGDTLDEVRELRAAGADLVVMPRLLVAGDFLGAIRAFDAGLLDEKQAELEAALKDRREILA